MKRILLATTCVIALGAVSPALADDDWTNGTPVDLTGDYGHLSVPGLDENSIGVTGSARFDLGWNNLSLQANGDYHYDWVGSFNANVGNVGGGLVWSGMNGRIAVNGNYHMLAGGNVASYGAGGEWFANPWLTVGLRGGGLSGTGGGSGGYFGGQLKGYVCPNFSLAGSVDYLNFSSLHETDYAVKAEYGFWGNLSLNANYTFTDVPGIGVNTFGLGLTLHLNGDATQVEHDRNGTADYITNIQPVFFKYAF